MLEHVIYGTLIMDKYCNSLFSSTNGEYQINVKEGFPITLSGSVEVQI